MAGSYDPHEYRKPLRPTSNLEVMAHLIKCTFGIGVLSLPHAISKAGYVMAAIIAFPTAGVLIYCIHVLIRTMYRICIVKQKPYISFEDCIYIVVREGPQSLQKSAEFWKLTVRTFLIVYPLGIGAAFTIFIAQSINNVFPLLSHKVGSLYIYEAIILLPLFLMNCLPNLHRMAVVSWIGNVLTLICFIGILYFFLSEPPLSSGEHKMFGSARRMFTFLGTIQFTLEGISVIISIEEHMKTPKSFLGYFGLFNISMIIVIVFYCLIGITGYIKYGDTALSSINMNLQQNLLPKILKWLFIFCIYYSYPIQCYPVIAFVWEDHLMMRAPEERRTLYEYLFRFGLTLFNVLTAMVLPRLDLFVSLIGAVCISTLGLYFPGFMEYLYFWKMNEGKINGTMIKDICIMIYGILVTIMVTAAVITTNIDEDWLGHKIFRDDNITQFYV